MDRQNEMDIQLNESLTYWKAHNTIEDVYSQELAYSLIFDNIHPNKMQEALATVGLSSLPSHFFLVQVDDYKNQTSSMQITQEYYQKTMLINLLRKHMREVRLEGFIGNLIGQERFICFLCCEKGETSVPDERLLQIAGELQACIRTESNYTLSICISNRCTSAQAYSQMFPLMDCALSESFFRGKEFVMILGDATYEADPGLDVSVSRDVYSEVLLSVSQSDPVLIDRAVQDMFDVLHRLRLSPQKTQLEAIRLIQRLESYCIRCGVPETVMADCDETAINAILATSFAADTRACFLEYCRSVAQTLETYVSNDERTFLSPVKEYIAEHYQEVLRLSDVSRAMGFSEGHFARLFRKNLHTTFVDYLKNYRIELSKGLLSQTHVCIEQIAYQVGFNSYSYFCTCFKELCGVSPGAYRSAQQSQ